MASPAAPFLKAHDDGLAGRYGDAVAPDWLIVQQLRGGKVRGNRERLVLTASIQCDDTAVIGGSSLEGVDLPGGVRLQQVERTPAERGVGLAHGDEPLVVGQQLRPLCPFVRP